MRKNGFILGLLLMVVALPFIFRQDNSKIREWRDGDPVLVVISAMNEAIRHEYGLAFSEWHTKRYGVPAKVDWRNIGGGTEIMRYLAGEFVSSFRAWWQGQGHPWRGDSASALLGYSFHPGQRPEGVDETIWNEQRAIYQAFRETDEASKFSSQLDLLFGGGAYDGNLATRQGLVVSPWPDGPFPNELFGTKDGTTLVPTGMSGETWRTDTYFGTTLSTFGICFNMDRVRQLGFTAPPVHWADLADPRWFGTLGLADPTKSGSIAKVFETIVQVSCRDAVQQAGYTEAQIEAWEKEIAAARLPPGEMPNGVPLAYQAAIERGWLEGISLLQRMGANARYFTDSGSQVVVDVGMGNAAAGLCIDFYGRFEAEISNGGRTNGAMGYITPRGGSGVGADPIALLRGAPHREVAVHFIEFLLSPEGQALWCYRVGTPGGPEQYALRRLPIRRDFYPSEQVPEFQASYERHRAFTADDLGDPQVDPYVLASEYIYHPRWTAGHFALFRDLVRAMSMDSGLELKQAWKAIIEAGGPEQQFEAMNAFSRLPQEPEPLTWASGLTLYQRYDRLDILRVWTLHFRHQYWNAESIARQTKPV